MLEEAKELMYKIIDKFGIESKQVLKVSQLIDDMLNEGE